MHAAARLLPRHHLNPFARGNRGRMVAWWLGGLVLAGPATLEGRPNIKDAFLAVYPSALGTQLDELGGTPHCLVCHYDFNGAGPKNPYGNALEAIGGLNKTQGREKAVRDLGSLDPEGDGWTSTLEVTVAGYPNVPCFPGLSAANVGSVVNVDPVLVMPYLTPSLVVDNTPPVVEVLGPNGGETLTANAATTISWSATDSSGIIAIHLHESLDGGATWKPLALGLSDTGTYTWQPANRPTTQGRIRVTAVDGATNTASDASDADYTIVAPPGGRVPTTLRDFDMPGTQPFEGGPEQAAPESCANCHGNYNAIDGNDLLAVEPYANWQGSMMALASLDPLFLANLAIANQDAPESGDLCLRCHLPNGWMQGRSTPTDGSRMLEHDQIGVACDLCHRMVNPDYVAGVSPLRDATVLGNLSFPFSATASGPQHGNGMYVVDSSAIQRGPYDDAVPPHNFTFSPFHRSSAFCGTCHDVSNPAFNRDGDGVYQANAFDSTNDNFSPHSMAPVERTYSEWLNSAYNTPLGVHAPEFAGTKPAGMVSSCQDCHLRDVSGYGANPATNPGVPLRADLPLHDMTGGSTWLPGLIAAAHPDKVSMTAVEAGIARASYMLQNAAELGVSQVGGQLAVRVTNNTGHKLPTGYPEGRRIWINVRFYDAGDNLLGESGAYDPATGVLSKTGSKIYEVHPGIDENISGVVGVPEGPSLHFVLNNKIFEDNRIPPRGFTNAAFAAFGGEPVGHHYDDGQYWDDTPYAIPAGTARAEVFLFYQSTSKEFVEFLRDENTTNSAGQDMYDLWDTNGKCPPELMASASLALVDPFTDSDGDGLTWLEETAFGSDPASADSAHRPESIVAGIDGTDYLAIRYTCVEDLQGAVIIPETSTDLVTWHAGPDHCVEHSETSNGDGTETLVVRMVEAMAPGARQFMRLRVEPM